MNDAARHDCQVLLVDNAAECSAIAAHYLQMVPQYADLHNLAGMRYSLKCAVEHVKAAVRSFKELEALAAPAEMREAAE